MTAISKFPPRPVRYVVPFGTGGPPDAIARLVAPALEARWGQPVTIDNRPGANGSLGSEFVVHSPPDGCTLLQGTSATHGSNAVLFPLLPFDPLRDLAPVAALIEGALYLGASQALPFENLQALVSHARAHPGELRFATAGPGSPQHLAGELLRIRAGIDIGPVHYGGAAQALRALVQGDVDMYFGSDFRAHPEAAGVRLLAVSTRWRWPFAPQVPTVVESGIADFEVHGWFGLFVPAGTPAEIVARINADVNAALEDRGLRSAIENFGYLVLGGSTADFTARLAREASFWTALVRRNGINLV